MLHTALCCCALMSLTPSGPSADPVAPLIPREPAVMRTLTTNAAVVAPAEGGALRATFHRADWPHVWFTGGTSYPQTDWSRAGAVLFDVRNPSTVPVTICFRVDDSDRADGGSHCRSAWHTLAPGQRAALAMPIPTDAAGMNGLPPISRAGLALPKSVVMMGTGGSWIDARHIVAFQLYMDHPSGDRPVDLFGVRWVARPPMRAIVDRYGQFTGGDWPGKLKTDAEFAALARSEAAWMKQHPPFADRDEYGGWKHGPRLRATGFFRTAVVRDGHEIGAPAFGERLPAGARWWFVTPSGTLFWSAGVDCVGTWAQTNVKGREPLFTWLPDGAVSAGQVSFYEVNLRRKYGARAGTAWVGAAMDRLRSWGFNTIGNWSDAAALRARKVPYTVAIHYGGLPSAEGTASPDFNDRRFPSIVDAAIDAATREWRDDPWCLGYFVDNEIGWPGGWDADRQRAFAERYFGVVRDAMRRHAPHQLYLGCRFAGRPKAFVDAAARYCDVVSFNIYTGGVDGADLRLTETLGKPILIGEYHFGALDRGMFSGGLQPRANQVARASAYASYVRSVLARPEFVGCHWFQYLDQPLTGRPDGENYNIGFVNVTDGVYPEMREAARRVNGLIYRGR